MERISVFGALLFICLTLLNPIVVNGQVVINEFLASNSGLNTDPDFGNSSDWIELYNKGNTTVNIGGYFLTDNFSAPEKWQIPQGTEIQAKQFLIIWADGKNTQKHTSFKLSAAGEELGLYSATGNVVDSLGFGPQKTNISMGRKGDGEPEWAFFTTPTPGTSNSSETFEGVVENVPKFSVPGGIFNSPVNIKITNTLGGSVHYTLDGSVPDKFSPTVTSPILIVKTTVVRARVFKTKSVPGKVITHTFFIDINHKIGSLPVISIASNPENFWDSKTGIYVQDFKPDWEVPINIELFENDGSDRAAFNLAAGAKVNGLYSWQLPQKMLGIYFRKSYGKGKLEYPLFFDRNRKKFDSFALRASGSDWAYTMFRDGMAQFLTAGNMEVDFQAQRACVVFINGVYMGIHNIRSKVDEDFVVQNHELGDQKIDMVENENYAEAGSVAQYSAFEELYKKDLSNNANYNLVAQQMDIENFTDFIITEIYARNTSVDHNIMAWKPQSGGKWKWILNDLDRTFSKPGETLISYYAARDVIPLRQLLENEKYKKYFGKRFANHLFTTFNPGAVKSTIDEFADLIRNEMPNHINRWKGTSSDYGNPISSVRYWENEVAKLKMFADARPAVLLNDLQKYGFGKSEPLSVSSHPENAGKILFNGLQIQSQYNEGAYPINEEITLEASSNNGYIFKGWANETTNIIVPKEETWKYNDKGEALPDNWKTTSYSDENWNSGKAQLGYGDGDENTVLSFGNNSKNKQITTYFRKSFSVGNTNEIERLKIRLKCDDGAVVYLNGTEVVRENLPTGEIGRLTKALSAIGGSAEDDFTTYTFDKSLLQAAKNTLAVEIHQYSGTSSDISFDLEFSSLSVSLEEFTSTKQNLKFTHTHGKSLVAVFETDGSCILPEEITGELTLNKACSPYKVPNNVKVESTGKLIIEPGVELWMANGVSIEIAGALLANGTENEPIIFRADPADSEKKWGILNFVYADTSLLSNVVIEDASTGNHPIREIAAVSAFHSVLTLDGVVIENVYANPVIARYSKIKMKNSKLHSEISGDLINIKYGKGFIDSCEFRGNNLPDTDAIDFDDVANGVIRNCMITGFFGSNSDGIDIGEKAKNIEIGNVVIYNITDKGVSVGQQSSATISNSVFVNCDRGVGIKDSSRVVINHCTFYGNKVSVSCFEKNAGNAGGNGVVTNSILSNVYDTTYFSDARSTLTIANSLSDNTELPSAKSNLFANPQFTNPNLFDFSLAGLSPCIGTATDGNMGADLISEPTINQPFISAIAYRSDLGMEIIEFLVLSNSGNVDIDLSGYEFTKGITFRFPENTTLPAGEKIHIANNVGAAFWEGRGARVFEWENGRLADEGEAVQLKNPAGIIVDKIRYNADDSWPETSLHEGIVLVSGQVDNHFGTNWRSLSLDEIVGAENHTIESELTFYPNPTTGIVFISGLNEWNNLLNVYNLSGVKVISQTVNASHSKIDLRYLPQGMYLLQCGHSSKKVILKQ